MEARVLAAAREVFGQQGYAGGRTLDIAGRAGVAERTVFRYYPTKAELFAAAVVSPFHDFVRDYIDQWRQAEHGVAPAPEVVRAFYSGLLDFLRANRGLVVALAAAREFEPEGTFPDLAESLGELLGGLDESMRIEAAARGFRGDPSISVRFLFGLAMTAQVHDDWLFGVKAHPTQDELLDELTGFTLWGLGAPGPTD